MAERNWFTFGGYDSRDFGIYISGSGTFNVPERDYDTAIVPGRNGALLMTMSRIENIELEYPAYIYSDFNDKIGAMRSAFMGLEGYQRLTDSYHPDEYRLAYFEGDVKVKTTKKLDAGSFTLTFVCKPQRYLVEGEEAVEIGTWGETTTVQGDVVTFDAEEATGIKSLTVPLSPVQSFNGYDKPWVGGAGKNKAGIIALSPSDDARITINTDLSSVTINGTFSSNTALNVGVGANGSSLVPEGAQLIQTNSVNARLLLLKKAGGQSRWINANTAFTILDTEYAGYFRYTIPTGTYNNTIITFQIEQGSTATDYAPYSNICPITGHTGVNVVVSPTQDAQDGTTYPVSWQSEAGTVYGGTVDVVSGELTVTDANIASYAGETLPSTWISDRDVYAAGTTPTTGAQVVYKLATPQTYQLTPAQVETLLGENNVWADTGDVSVEYGQDPFAMVNPTQQTAHPILRVYGYGTLVVGSTTITIASHANAYIDIDCEVMDCHCGAVNCNSLVTFSTHEFPTFPAGVTHVSYSGNITKVEVEPNWWRA